MHELQVCLDKDEVLRMLNQPQPDRRRREQTVLNYFKSGGSGAREEIQSLWRAEVSNWYRYRVDDWLDTGLNRDGSESPTNRDVFRTTNAGVAVMHYAEDHPAQGIFSPRLAGLQIVVGEPHALSDKWDEFFCEAAKEADRLFTSMMATGWRFSVSKCRHEPCGRYFWIDKPRAIYRYGVFCCQVHQYKSSVAAAKMLGRARAQHKLIGFAARKLSELRINSSTWQTDTEVKRRLCAELCLYISEKRLHGYRERVGCNWLTRHGSEVEQRRAGLRSRSSTTATEESVAANVEQPEIQLRWRPKMMADERHFTMVLTL